MAPNVLEDQYAQLRGQLLSVNDKINTQQTLLQQLQAQKQEIQNAINDIRAAYLAWKGTPL